MAINDDPRVIEHKGAQIVSVKLTDDLLTIETSKGLIRFYPESDCCANHYLMTDDDLADFSRLGTTFLGVEHRKGGAFDDGEWGGLHEIGFFVVHTSKGDLVIASHNRHNGYYGGTELAIQ